MSNQKEIIEETLFAVPVPEKTHSYQPVAHAILVSAIKEKLYKHDMRIEKTHYTSNGNASQMFGVMNIARGNGEQLMNIGFRNSYDKSLAVGLVAGATVIVCSNLMFKGDIKTLRKHTTGVFNDLDNIVESVVLGAAEQFDRIQIDSEKMKLVELTKKQMAEIAGRLFINENLINSTQMGIIKREINFSDEFTDPSLWTLYNHFTESLKVTAPALRMQKQIAVHGRMLQLL